MFREIVPNLVAPLIVYTTLLIPVNIIFEASLSYLGVGIPPGTPSWGRMIADATEGQLYRFAWWMLFFPGLMLVLTTLAFNLVGDALRDALDPEVEPLMERSLETPKEEARTPEPTYRHVDIDGSCNRRKEGRARKRLGIGDRDASLILALVAAACVVEQHQRDSTASRGRPARRRRAAPTEPPPRPWPTRRTSIRPVSTTVTRGRCFQNLMIRGLYNYNHVPGEEGDTSAARPGHRREDLRATA